LTEAAILPTFERRRSFPSRSGELRRRRVDFAFEFGPLRRDDGTRANASATNDERFLAFLGAGSNAFEIAKALRKRRLRLGLKLGKTSGFNRRRGVVFCFLGQAASLARFLRLFSFSSRPIFSDFLLESRQNFLETPPRVGYNRKRRRRVGGCVEALTGDSALDCKLKGEPE